MLGAQCQPAPACENDRVPQKVVDQVVVKVVGTWEEGRVRPLSDWLLYGTAAKTHTATRSRFYNSGKISEGGERFWFLWPQRELGVNHAPFEIAVPHPRSISACWFLLHLDEPTPSMHANSSAALITDYSSCRTNSEAQFFAIGCVNSTLVVTQPL